MLSIEPMERGRTKGGKSRKHQTTSLINFFFFLVKKSVAVLGGMAQRLELSSVHVECIEGGARKREREKKKKKKGKREKQEGRRRRRRRGLSGRMEEVRMKSGCPMLRGGGGVLEWCGLTAAVQMAARRSRQKCSNLEEASSGRIVDPRVVGRASVAGLHDQILLVGQLLGPEHARVDGGAPAVVVLGQRLTPLLPGRELRHQIHNGRVLDPLDDIRHGDEVDVVHLFQDLVDEDL